MKRTTKARTRALSARKRGTTKPLPPYHDLDDFIDAFESWDGDYDTFDVETSADY